MDPLYTLHTRSRAEAGRRRRRRRGVLGYAARDKLVEAVVVAAAAWRSQLRIANRRGALCRALPPPLERVVASGVLVRRLGLAEVLLVPLPTRGEGVRGQRSKGDRAVVRGALCGEACAGAAWGALQGCAVRMGESQRWAQARGTLPSGGGAHFGEEEGHARFLEKVRADLTAKQRACERAVAATHAR